MEYFATKRRFYRNPFLLMEVEKVLSGLTGYADTIYGKGRSSSVLEEAKWHIIDSFNNEKGDLENYATKVVKTIGRSSYSKELPTEEVEWFASISEEDVFGSSIKALSAPAKVIPRVVELFVLNFDKIGNSKKLPSSITNALFKDYTIEEIAPYFLYLIEKYSGEARSFIEKTKGKSMYTYREGLISSKRDDKIVKVSEIGDVVVYKSRVSRVYTRYLYKIDLASLLLQMKRTFYQGDDCLALEVDGVKAYIGLNGGIYFNWDQLCSDNIDLVICAVLSRCVKLAVLEYSKGTHIILSTPSVLDTPAFLLDVFDREFWVHMSLVRGKYLNRGI